LTSRAYCCFCFLSIVLLLSSFHGVFLTETRFSPEGRWFSRNSGCQDAAVLPQIWVWGLFCFCCYSLLHCFLWRSLAIFGRAFSIVVLVYFCRYNLPLWCSQFSPLELTRPHPIVASLFVLVPSLNFPQSSLSIKTGSLRFHFSFWSSSSSRRAPSIAFLNTGRGE
jgi:hypothetical protein